MLAFWQTGILAWLERALTSASDTFSEKARYSYARDSERDRDCLKFHDTTSDHPDTDTDTGTDTELKCVNFHITYLTTSTVLLVGTYGLNLDRDQIWITNSNLLDGQSYARNNQGSVVGGFVTTLRRPKPLTKSVCMEVLYVLSQYSRGIRISILP